MQWCTSLGGAPGGGLATCPVYLFSVDLYFLSDTLLLLFMDDCIYRSVLWYLLKEIIVYAGTLYLTTRGFNRTFCLDVALFF